MTPTPEHEVKAMLARHGVAVPRGTTDLADAGTLRQPLVLKAFGEQIVHKSELGAVVLGLAAHDVAGAAETMQRQLHPAGFLVEEQAQPGLEMLVGVVDRGFGPALAVGQGGTRTEVLDDITFRMLPVTADDVGDMLRELRCWPLLEGFRGAPGVDIEALVTVVLGVCTLATELGASLRELECNPVIAQPDSAIAVDARLLLRTAADAETAPTGAVAATGRTDFHPLFAPRGVAVAGASATKQTFGNRFLDAYRAVGWRDGLIAIHPSATAIGDVPAYPDLRSAPGPIDYVVAAVPAPACAELVRSAAGVAPFVHVISGGFGETGAGGTALEDGLRVAAHESGVRVLGPNCMGVYSPTGRQTFQLGAPVDAGTIGVISQSGGLAGDIIKVGAARGLRFSKLVTVGNAVDVTPAELCDWLVDDPDTQILGLYLEDPRDGAGLVRALDRAADAGKPAVVLVGGLSRQGGAAVASHTGSLAGDRRMWHAISARTGAAVVGTLEDLLGALAYLQRYPRPLGSADPSRPPTGERNQNGGSVLVVGVGGGASVLTTDACDRAGLLVTAVDADVQSTLHGMGYGAGTSVANPIEIPFGPAAPPDAFSRVLEPILAVQPYPDVLLHINVQAFFSFAADGGDKLLPVTDAIATLASTFSGLRFSLVGRNLETAPGELADRFLARAIEQGVVVYRTADEAAAAIAAAQHRDAITARRRRASRTATSD